MVRHHFLFGALLVSSALSATTYAADDFTLPLHVSTDGPFLAQPDGEPFFWLADTGWSMLMRLDREETDEYLEDRAAKGFTVIQAVVMGGPADRLDIPNRYAPSLYCTAIPAGRIRSISSTSTG